MAKPTRIVLTGAALALTLTGCAAGGSDPATPSDPLGHVHGLGLDPASGETYAATHDGVWLLPTDQLPGSYPAEDAASTGAPRKIGGNSQDTMGFTVAGPGLLYASGHPAPGEQTELPTPNLGLIRSTDRANTWESVSLSGEVDFHDLDTVPLPDGQTRVYGYDATAGVIRVSDDSGTSWQEQAAIDLRDLAADPTNPDRLYATTSNGFLMSEDRGATFDRVEGAPPLYLVDVADDGGGFVGVDVTGQIWSSDGRSWVKRAMVQGTPEAFAYVGGDDEHWVLIADERGIVATPDYGETVTVLTTNEG
ncbi:hypothetical protein ROT00_07430 [Agromyces mediolanus]|uniref:F510_1955 family glycosylhydrolase n=1 Tax=Agromyces mediolanus TaxID=41986 RepID=UPI003837886E